MICLINKLQKSFTICEFLLKLLTTLQSHFYWQITLILKATYRKFYINFLSTYMTYALWFALQSINCCNKYEQDH